MKILKKILFYLKKVKLSLIRKFLNFSVSTVTQKGFIIIQLDGLSYDNMQLALKKGYLPKIKKYIISKGYESKKLYSPLPSNTPSFQKSLMYGDTKKIPGFRWFDKEMGKFYSFKNPETSQKIEQELKDRDCKGILKGGVSYLNFFSGDADRSYLTMSRILTSQLSQRVSGLKIFLIIFLNFFNIIGIMYWILKELFLELYDDIYYFFNSIQQRNFIFFPFVRLFNNVIINEYITNGVCFEILCGTPKIYVTFYTYDEMAHQRGPTSQSSLSVLKLIDNSIYKIFQFAEDSKLKKYDFFILSDHGSAKSKPFSNLFNCEIKDIILKYCDEIASYRNMILNRHSSWKEHTIQKKLMTLSKERAIPYTFSKFISPYLKKRELSEEFIVKDINIIPFGPVANLYINRFKNKMNISQIIEKYPLLIENLLSHSGIKCLLMKDNDDVIILFKESLVRLKGGKVKDGVLQDDFSDSKQLLLDIENFINTPDTGDIIIISEFFDGNLINFENQMSCHGGFGYAQTDSFLIYSKGLEQFISKIDDPFGLYDHFIKNY